MGTLFILAYVGIPCTAALLWLATPRGRRWLKENNLL